jgi:hypothetical protein
MKKRSSKKTVESTPGVDATLKRSGGLSYLEIAAADIGESAAFYKKVLGWNTRDGGDPSKFSDQTGHLIGRFVTGRALAARCGFLPFFYTDRVRAAVKGAAANRGKIVKPPHPEGDILLAVVRDPAGNLLGLWQERG